MVGRSSKWFVAVVLILVAVTVADDAEARRRRRRGGGRGRNTNFARALQQAQLLNLLLASQVNPTFLGGGFYPGTHGLGAGGGIDLRPIAPTQPAPPAGQSQQQAQTNTGAACDQTKALNTLMAAKGRCTGCHTGIDFKIENSKLVVTNGPKGNSDLAGFIRAVSKVSQMSAFEDVVKQLSPSGCQN